MKLKLETPEHQMLMRSNMLASNAPRQFSSEPGLQSPRVFGAVSRNKYGGYNVHYYLRAIVPEEFHSEAEALAYVESDLGDVLEATHRLLGETE